MGKPTYWLDLFTGTTWQEFLDEGAKVSGFRDRRWKTVQSIKPGDFLLCYLTGLSRFIGLLEVVSQPFRDESKIWKDESFPCRVRAKPSIALTPETAVPVQELRDQLSIFSDLKSPNAWTGHFRGSPVCWKAQDALAVVKALEDAKAHPVPREVDPAKLARRPKALAAKIGPVSVPGTEESTIPEAEVEGNAIVAAFEVESTTSVYSGLLRMADLLAMQPNINIPLFLVAPAERRNKVIAEVNRPTFQRLSPPLVEMGRYLSFASIRKRIKEVGPVVKYLKPEFLDEVAESCELEAE